jgi:hypothetical protein
LKKLSYKIIRGLGLIVLIGQTLSISAQNTAIDAVDAYFKAVSSNDFSSNFFAPSATVSSIVYDSLGESNLNTLSIESYKQEIASLHASFEVDQHPMVLIVREYGNVVSIYCSYWLNLTDKQTGELLTSKGIQSIKLITDEGNWKIYQALIQNENPSFPLDESLLPKELTELLQTEDTSTLFDDYGSNYDPNKVYQITEVDEPPVYPDTKGYEDLLKSYDVVSTPTIGYTPFLITINEDGSAELSYAHDLSGYQITRAESFVRSMLIWYPAIKYAASVKCKQIFYIRD